jgi:hypothetical protein
VIAGTSEIYEAHKEHKEMWGETGKVVGGVVGGIVGTALVTALALTPVGWAAVIGYAALDAAVAVGGYAFLSHVGQKFGKKLHHIEESAPVQNFEKEVSHAAKALWAWL